MTLRASEMGLTESQFWELSFCEYVWKWNGYMRRIEREQWQTAREIVSIIYNTNAKRGKQKKSKNLIPLSIDPVIKHMSEEEAKKIFDNLPEHWRTTAKDN